MSFATYFLSKGCSPTQAEHLAAALLAAHPWLNFQDELSEELSEDLLGQCGDWWMVTNRSDLVDWYNLQVRKTVDDNQETASDDYGSLRNLLTQFGVEDAFGRGRFWLVADSFSTHKLVIVDCDKEPIQRVFMDALRSWLELHSRYSELSVRDVDGNVRHCIETTAHSR